MILSQFLIDWCWSQIIVPLFDWLISTIYEILIFKTDRFMMTSRFRCHKVSESVDPHGNWKRRIFPSLRSLHWMHNSLKTYFSQDGVRLFMWENGNNCRVNHSRYDDPTVYTLQRNHTGWCKHYGCDDDNDIHPRARIKCRYLSILPHHHSKANRLTCLQRLH